MGHPFDSLWPFKLNPFFSPHLGGLHNYELHRTTLAQAFGGAAQGASPGNPRTIPEQAFLAQLRAAQPAACTSTEDTVENTGIEVGEIIAWRAWRLRNDDILTSVHIEKTLWPPGAVVSGVVNNICGVHAFKSQYDAIVFGSNLAALQPILVGQVALWGQVIEHELGYRASYACVHSLDILFPQALVFRPWFRLWRGRRLRKLRELYNVGKAPDANPYIEVYGDVVKPPPQSWRGR